MEDVTEKFPIINDRYKILNTIGTGGTSTVYEAHDIVLERSVALKMLSSDFASDLNISRNFRSEAKASAKLTHPNIVRTYDYGYENGRLYIVMELVTGTDLKQELIKREHTLEQFLIWIKQACIGLSYAHQRGIVHCDIKPQNLLIGTDNILRITDFGISRILGEVSIENTQSEVWGSPYYMAPEVTNNKQISPTIDIYAMGVILFELFTGSLPFTGRDAFELVQKHQSEKIPPPSRINPKINQSVEVIILKCLQKRPEDRYRNGAELLQSLENLLVENDFAPKIYDENTSHEERYNQIPDQPVIKKSIDWLTVGLGLLALITIGGLIPFWLFIYFFINR